jgi:predicted site-specific integrase-resolvase
LSPTKSVAGLSSPISSEDSYTDRRGLAQEYGVSLRTVDNWVRRKIIPVVRITKRCLRFRRNAVRRALAKFEEREVSLR